MEPSILFETTKAAFARFKAQGNRCHYPKNLKEDALKLLAYYSESTLCAALGVTTVSLRNWRKEKNQQTNSSPAFMTLDIDDFDESVSRLLPNVTQNTVALTVHLPHQLSLSLPEQSVKKTVHFVCALIKEFDSCCI